MDVHDVDNVDNVDNADTVDNVDLAGPDRAEASDGETSNGRGRSWRTLASGQLCQSSTWTTSQPPPSRLSFRLCLLRPIN